MPRTIRILHVLHAFSAGGLENGIVNIINRSPDHLIHELCLLSKGGEFLDRLTRPVAVHELNKTSGNSARLILRLRELFRSRAIDVIHTRNWAAFDGVLAACLTSKASVVHGEHGRDISDPRGMLYRRNLARRLLSFRVKKYVAVSKDLYTWLKQTVRLPADKLAFIPNGVDTDRFSPGRDPKLRKELGIGQDEWIVGAVGRLDPIKNHRGLINALGLLQKGGYPVRLLIVGDGPIREEISNSMRRASLAPKPLLLGYRPDVERLYKIFDVFVLNSFAEGMSNTLLEAMASAVPIVCTAVGGNTELIVNRRGGILVAPGDDGELARTLQECINSPDECRSYADHGRRFILDRCSIGQMVAEYASIYEAAA